MLKFCFRRCAQLILAVALAFPFSLGSPVPANAITDGVICPTVTDTDSREFPDGSQTISIYLFDNALGPQCRFSAERTPASGLVNVLNTQPLVLTINTNSENASNRAVKDLRIDVLESSRGRVARNVFVNGSYISPGSITIIDDVSSIEQINVQYDFDQSTYKFTTSLNPFTNTLSGFTIEQVPVEINLVGNGQTIGDDPGHTPSLVDETDFGAVDVDGGTQVRTFTIQNTGNADLTLGANAVSMAGTAASDFTVTQQPATTVAANASTTFQITFDPSLAGLRGPVDVTIANNDSDENPYNFRVQGTGVVADAVGPTLAIETPDETRGPFTAVFRFSDTVNGFIAADISVRNGLVSNFIGSDGVSVFIATITPVRDGGLASTDITIDVAVGAAHDDEGNPSKAAQAVVRFIDEKFIQTRTSAIINNFMADRADQIVGNEPDLHTRLDGFVPGGLLSAYTTSGISLQGEYTPGNADLSVATSLSQLMQRASGERSDITQGKNPHAFFEIPSSDPSIETVYGKQNLPDPQPSFLSRFDIWFQGAFTKIDSESRDTELAIAYAGIDYKLNKDFLIGLLGQYDRTEQGDGLNGFSIGGSGWLAGPYLVARLHDQAIFESRLAYGQSYNGVSPFNTYTDDFNTERFLAKAKITGKMDVSGINIAPHFGLLYFREEQGGYIDSLGITIPNETIEYGRVTFGPTISTEINFDNGATVSPHFELNGIWNFVAPERREIATGLTISSAEGLHARIETGLTFAFANGWNLRGHGFFDGIGKDDFGAYGSTVRLNIPLN